MKISIRTPLPADAPAVAEAVRESLPELGAWMDWAVPEYDLFHARSWIYALTTGRAEGTEYEFLIVGDDGRVLGACGINQINRNHRFGNLGYWVRTSAAGRGAATLAVPMLARWTFQNTELERLEIVTGVGNRASERVAEKAGAEREGVLRSRLRVRGSYQDATMFSLVRPRDGGSGGPD